jgi:hypothetical protein
LAARRTSQRLGQSSSRCGGRSQDHYQCRGTLSFTNAVGHAIARVLALDRAPVSVAVAERGIFVDCMDKHSTIRTLACAKTGTSGNFSTTPDCTKISPHIIAIWQNSIRSACSHTCRGSSEKGLATMCCPATSDGYPFSGHRRNTITLGMPSITFAQQKVLTEKFRPKDALRLLESSTAFPFPVSEGALRKSFRSILNGRRTYFRLLLRVKVARFFSICFE